MQPSTFRVRTLGAAAAVSLLAVGLTACSSDTNSPAADCTPTHSDVETISDGKLTVGVIDIPPFSSYGSGNPVGIDVSIVERFAEDACLEVAWQQATYADAIQSIGGGTIDLAIGTIDRTEARQKVVDFSATTYLDGLGIATTSGAQTITDLEALGAVGTIDGYLWVEDLRAILGDRLKTYPSSVELKADFEAGRLDAVVDAYGVLVPSFAGDDSVTVALANSNPDPRVQAIVTAPQAAFPLTKGNTSLNTAISSTIETLRADGEIIAWLQEAGLSEDLAGTEEDLAGEYSVPES